MHSQLTGVLFGNTVLPEVTLSRTSSELHRKHSRLDCLQQLFPQELKWRSSMLLAMNFSQANYPSVIVSNKEHQRLISCKCNVL